MKHSILLSANLLLFAMASFAQEKEHASKAVVPPQSAKTAFAKSFPGSSKIKWEKEGDGFEVNFLQDDKQMSAVYNNAGELQETELTIATTALPADIITYVHEHYKAAKIKEAAKITKANGEINYEAEVNKKDVIFNSNGKFIREAKD